MRTLIGVIIAAAVLWSGYWFFGATAAERGLKDWFAARQAEGWQATYSDINTRGYPNRFDTTITDLNLADPDTGIAWTMPFFQILTLSYTPNHIVVNFPDTQQVANPVESLTVDAGVMRGSIIFQPDTSLAIDRTSFEMADLNVASSLGWSAAVAKGQFATRQSGGPDRHEVFVSASDVRPSQPLLNWIDPDHSLPTTFSGVRLDMVVGFDAAWDRFALERRRPQPVSLDLKTFSADWGELTLQATGTLEIDDLGVPTGQIDVRAKNWQDMVQIAVDTGLIGAGSQATVERMLGVLAGLTGNPQTLDAPVSFDNGKTYVAGLPVGPAPRLVLY